LVKAMAVEELEEGEVNEEEEPELAEEEPEEHIRALAKIWKPREAAGQEAKSREEVSG